MATGSAAGKPHTWHRLVGSTRLIARDFAVLRTARRSAALATRLVHTILRSLVGNDRYPKSGVPESKTPKTS